MQMPSTKTLYTYWNTIRGSRSAPDRRDIDPTRIREALAYTFILTLHLPGFWLHPFGPLAKNLPFLALIWLLFEIDRGS